MYNLYRYGAAALTRRQIEIAFDCYATGEYKEAAHNFDVDVAGSKSDEYLSGTIKPLLKKTPKRWQRLIAEAYALGAPRATPAKRPNSTRHRELIEGSSPVRSE